MVDRWPTLEPPGDVEPRKEPQKPAKDHFLPDKEFQGAMEVVTVTRGMYGTIHRTSKIIREKRRDKAKTKTKD